MQRLWNVLILFLEPSENKLSMHKGCKETKNFETSLGPLSEEMDMTTSLIKDCKASLLWSTFNIALLLIRCFSPTQPKRGSETTCIYRRDLNFPISASAQMTSIRCGIPRFKKKIGTWQENMSKRKKQSMCIYIKGKLSSLATFHRCLWEGFRWSQKKDTEMVPKNQVLWWIQTQSIPKTENKLHKWSSNVKRNPHTD